MSKAYVATADKLPQVILDFSPIWRWCSNICAQPRICCNLGCIGYIKYCCCARSGGNTADESMNLDDGTPHASIGMNLDQMNVKEVERREKEKAFFESFANQT